MKLKNINIAAKLILGLSLFAILTGCGSSVTPAADPFEIRPSDHIKGNPDAVTTLIEYSDFQCPACGTAHSILKDLPNDFPDTLRIVYRHFPLDFHKQAIPAVRASEAAGQQGKFFEMHDLLFDNQDEWSGAAKAKDLFVSYAEHLNLDIEKFKIDYNSGTIIDRIAIDKADNAALQIQGTPTLYLNGKQIRMQAYPDLKKTIEEAIANPTIPASASGEQPL